MLKKTNIIYNYVRDFDMPYYSKTMKAYKR